MAVGVAAGMVAAVVALATMETTMGTATAMAGLGKWAVKSNHYEIGCERRLLDFVFCF
jgi:hypothetical protein